MNQHITLAIVVVMCLVLVVLVYVAGIDVGRSMSLQDQSGYVDYVRAGAQRMWKKSFSVLE
jgi:hypothetical protein